MKRLIYKLFYILTHAVLRTIKFLSFMWISCKMHVVNLVSRPHCDSKTLQKIPKNLGIIINEDTIIISDVAKVILWCVTIGIPHLSVYDYSGHVKHHKAELCTEIKRSQNHQSSQENCVSTHSHTMKVHITTPVAHSSQIHLLSWEDGRRHLQQTTQHLAHLVKSQRLKCGDIQPEYVDFLLQEKLSFPDPDAVLQFGEVQSLVGFLPWQTRLTEIIQVPTLKGLDCSSLVSSLHKYAATQQRYGK